MGHGGGSHGGGGGGHHSSYHSHSHGGGGGGDCTLGQFLFFVITGLVVLICGCIVGIILTWVLSDPCNHIGAVEGSEQAVCDFSKLGSPYTNFRISTDCGNQISYLLPAFPQLKTGVIRSRNVTDTSYIGSMDWEYWSFTMNRGSSVTYTMTADSPITFRLLTSDNYNSFKQDQYYDSLYYVHGTNFSGTYEVTQADNDEFYFVMDNWAGHMITVQWHLQVNETTLDLSSFIDKCSGSCSMSTKDHSNVVVTVGPKGTYQGGCSISMRKVLSDGGRAGITVALAAILVAFVAGIAALVFFCIIKH